MKPSLPGRAAAGEGEALEIRPFLGTSRLCLTALFCFLSTSCLCLTTPTDQLKLVLLLAVIVGYLVRVQAPQYPKRRKS